MIGSCQANVERHKVGLGRPEPGVTRSARWPIPVSWEQVQADPDGSTVVRRPICTGNVAKDFFGEGEAGQMSYISGNQTIRSCDARALVGLLDCESRDRG